MTDTKNLIHCELCNYKTERNYDWLKHLQSQKHQRNGQKKINKCEHCDYESTHWNVKIHKLQKHATQEERSQQKYYCVLCDSVFFCKQYLDKHNAGRNHQVKLKVQQSLDEIKVKINFNNNE